MEPILFNSTKPNSNVFLKLVPLRTTLLEWIYPGEIYSKHRDIKRERVGNSESALIARNFNSGYRIKDPLFSVVPDLVTTF